MQKESAKIWQGWLDSIEAIPEESGKGELALAIFRYALRNQEYKGQNVIVNVLMQTIKRSIDISNMNAENGRRGGQQRVANSTASSTASSDPSSTASYTIDNRHKTIDIKTKDNIDINNKNLTPKGDKAKRTKSTNDFDIVGFLQSKGVTEQHIHDYLIVRKEKKATNTLTAMQRIDAQVVLAGITWDEAVTCCIEWDWKGFNHEWYLNKKREQNNSNNGIYQSRQREDSRRETPAPDRHTISAADMLF